MINIKNSNFTSNIFEKVVVIRVWTVEYGDAIHVFIVRQIGLQFRCDVEELRLSWLSHMIDQHLEDSTFIVWIHSLIDFVNTTERHLWQVLQRQTVNSNGHGTFTARLYKSIQCSQFFSVSILYANLDAILLIISITWKNQVNFAGTVHRMHEFAEIAIDRAHNVRDFCEPFIV